jgi:hypothetical protein
MMRYAPDSGFFLMLKSEHKRKIQRGGNISLKKIPLPGEEGERKKKPKCDGKPAVGFPFSCSF